MSDYAVVLLIEQPLTPLDVSQVLSLHEAVEDPVRYHVLMPVENAAVRVESAMSSLGNPDLHITAPAEYTDTQRLQDSLGDEARQGLGNSVQALVDAGANAEGRVIEDDPIEGLVVETQRLDAAEVIVMTRPHVVAEFFHVDWSARARRKLGVPVLHLLEAETFAEQSEEYGDGEGITGF